MTCGHEIHQITRTGPGQPPRQRGGNCKSAGREWHYGGLGWQYYAEQVRKARYDLNNAALAPYFELDRVLRDGVFYTAQELYGISFKERRDIPVFHPDVRVFEVFDRDGSPLALFYCDYFKRDNKNGGAWMDNLVGQSKLLGTRPVILNVANFSKPSPQCKPKSNPAKLAVAAFATTSLTWSAAPFPANTTSSGRISCPPARAAMTCGSAAGETMKSSILIDQ